MKKLLYVCWTTSVVFFFSVLLSCQDDEPNGVKDVKVNTQDELVTTPFGQIPKSKVFAVDQGFTTKIENNQLLKIEESTGKVVQVLAELSSSANRDPRGQTSARTEVVAPLRDYGGDILVVHNTAPSNDDDFYTRFSAQFSVPVAPTQTAVTIFTGLRMDIFDASGRTLLVALQYGPSAAGGGWYWSVTAWQIDSGYNVTYYPISSANGNQNIAVGNTYKPTIAWDSNNKRYRVDLNGGTGTALMTYAPILGSPTSPAGVPISDIYVFLDESPTATTPLYSSDQCLPFTNINVQANGSTTTVNWGDGKLTGTNKELLTIASNSSTAGEVDICFSINTRLVHLSYGNNSPWSGLVGPSIYASYNGNSGANNLILPPQPYPYVITRRMPSNMTLDFYGFFVDKEPAGYQVNATIQVSSFPFNGSNFNFLSTELLLPTKNTNYQLKYSSQHPLVPAGSSDIYVDFGAQVLGD